MAVTHPREQVGSRICGSEIQERCLMGYTNLMGYINLRVVSIDNLQ